MPKQGASIRPGGKTAASTKASPSASDRRMAAAATEARIARSGSAEQVQTLLAALTASGEIEAPLEADDLADASETDDLDAEQVDGDAVDFGDGPDDPDEFDLQRDPTVYDDASIPLADATAQASALPTENHKYVIAISRGEAHFTPPLWSQAPAKGKTPLAQRALYDLSHRFRCYDALSRWLNQHRPHFLESFSLRGLGPNSLDEAFTMVRNDTINCLQKGMTTLLNKMDPTLKLREWALSNYLNGAYICFEGRHYMALRDLFAPEAQAAWAAQSVVSFMAKRSCDLKSLKAAQGCLGQKALKQAAERLRGEPLESMPLEDFILFVYRPLSGSLRIKSVFAQAYDALAEQVD